MTTLQEYLNEKYPTSEDKARVERIIICKINQEREKQGITELLEGGELVLGEEYVNLKRILINGMYLQSDHLQSDNLRREKELELFNNLGICSLAELAELAKLNETNLDYSPKKLTNLTLNCPNLTILDCSLNHLTTTNFLSSLPHPEKLTKLTIYNNNIQPNDIAVFAPFVNLERLKIGTMDDDLRQGKRNKFFGSFESWKNLTKLNSICIEATDVNEGLEYLPFSLAESTMRTATKGTREGEKGGGCCCIECSPHDTQAKCSAIQNELRPFNYDLLAWQLAHPEKMLITQPELFIKADIKEQWLTALENKIKESQEALTYLIQNESQTTKTIRLETQIKILKETENQLQEEIELEREIHTDSLKAMDNFYQQNPPSEEQRLNNILKVIEPDYLKTNLENKQKGQKIQELEEVIKIIEKLAQQRIQELENKINHLEGNQQNQQVTEIKKDY